ncbi:probable insulin-like peptide 5 [Drosophila biarmipes]|uniref:probable insulin-like peptide 5 n=1 Tax=Drosophila biarmipes TaxID=125945 RepID=UPI0007E8A7E3|nr:probable insulin-like peptide 5 [Drosophila biarmipes]
MLSYGHKLKVVSFDVLTLKISRRVSTHADPKRLIRSDRWKCAGGYKRGFQRRKVHQILSSSKTSKTMMFRTVFPLLLVLIPLLGCAEAISHSQRLCGPSLIETMMMMCPDGFSGYYQKRNSMIFDYVNAEAGDENEVSGEHHGRINSLTGLRRIYRGIFDECCLKPCHRNTMLKYCKE